MEKVLIENLHNTIVNPDRKYWFERSDGVLKNGDGDFIRHKFFTNDMYFINQIPAIKKTNKKKPDYFNAEIYNSPSISTVSTPDVAIYPWDFIQNKALVDNPSDPSEMRNYLKDLVLNLPYNVENKLFFYSRIKVNNLIGGSRGWGFWNTNTSLNGNNTSWFIQLNGDDESLKDLNGFWAVTQRGLNMSMIKLKDLDEEWHDYKIFLTTESVEYYVDDILVHKELNTNCIPNAPMAFHNWVDNSVFGLGLLGIKHVPQYTNEIRSNCTKNLVLQWGW
jgi:hypothetical protein